LHAAARTGKLALQAPRWTSATLYRARYRVSEANELLRALNQPEARASGNQPSPPAFRNARSRARRSLPVLLRCERRARERSSSTRARGVDLAGGVLAVELVVHDA
jgi:hypothetical protein